MPFGLRLSTYTAVSVAALAGACVYAAATRKNYYSAMVFLWSSKSVALVRLIYFLFQSFFFCFCSMTSSKQLLNNLAFLSIYFFGLLLKRTFFGDFRPVELSVRSFYCCGFGFDFHHITIVNG